LQPIPNINDKIATKKAMRIMATRIWCTSKGVEKETNLRLVPTVETAW
jgi:hypothetical protein